MSNNSKSFVKKHKGSGDKEFAPAYFNSATKAVINSKYRLDKSFQEILYGIVNWINVGSGWIFESIEVEYVNISIYSPLSGNTCMKLSNKLKHSMKSLVNIKNNDNKCFLWCHIKDLNPLKIYPQRITTKTWLMILIMKVLNFLSLKKIFARLNRKIVFALMYFVMKMN